MSNAIIKRISQFFKKNKHFVDVNCPTCLQSFHLCRNSFDLTVETDPDHIVRKLCTQCHTISEWNISDEPIPFLERHTDFHLNILTR